MTYGLPELPELPELLKWGVGVLLQINRTYRTEILLNNLEQSSFLQIYSSLNTCRGHNTLCANNIAGYSDHSISGPHGLNKAYYKYILKGSDDGV
jgi:hypothetical protein